MLPITKRLVLMQSLLTIEKCVRVQIFDMYFMDMMSQEAIAHYTQLHTDTILSLMAEYLLLSAEISINSIQYNDIYNGRKIALDTIWVWW